MENYGKMLKMLENFRTCQKIVENDKKNWTIMVKLLKMVEKLVVNGRKLRKIVENVRKWQTWL